METKPQNVTKLNVSIGTAAVLGLADVPMGVAPTTAYLMLGGRCLMNCAFCAQARESEAGAIYLSRVSWPEFDQDLVIERLANAALHGAVRRACLQVTVTADAFQHTLSILTSIKAATDLPFDVAILPLNLEQARQLAEAGADHIGFGLDAACQRVYDQVKGGDWARTLALIEDSARALPGRSALHLIVGLGETEREMVERIQWAHDLGITVGLFAFTPVRGTHLRDALPPPLAVYRRMQAARWLISHDRTRVDRMTFNESGILTELGASPPATGEPFQTSGCPDCNRPYYNERPGGVMYNYPRPLTEDEAARVILEMEIESSC